MASLPTILILGADTVAAANPATAVQLVHACRMWGFSAVIPASWGDELIAADVIRRCRDAEKPLIQCSCPRVAERLAGHASILDGAILWLVSPPVAAARYIRALEPNRAIHVTYAGSCPGVSDASIDESISPIDLLAAISGRGIDIAAQPKVFDDIVPADRRRHLSAPGGLPDEDRLWEAAAFRVNQPADANLGLGVAQLLLAEERLLVDLSPMMGCVCRVNVDSAAESRPALQRSDSPVVVAGKVDVSRPAPVVPQPTREASAAQRPSVQSAPPTEGAAPAAPPRSSPSRPTFRRQSTWRRQSPRPGVVVARTSGVMMAVAEPSSPPWKNARVFLTAALVAVALLVAFWIGRRTSAPTPRSTGDAGVSAARIH